jgi:hypothetical protein
MAASAAVAALGGRDLVVVQNLRGPLNGRANDGGRSTGPVAV